MAKQLVCTNCCYIGNSVKVTKGSFIMELFLWLLLLIPGIFYSIWRLTTKYDACPSCGAPNMVSVDSPRGKKLVQEFNSTSV